MKIADIINFTYPWLEAVRRSLPQGAMWAMLPNAESVFLLAQELERLKTERHPRIVPLAEIRDFETRLLRILAVANPDLGELALALARLIPAFFAHPPAACEWLYQQLLAGKAWAAVRESDPEHPAPERQWPLDVSRVLAEFDRLSAKAQEA